MKTYLIFGVIFYICFIAKSSADDKKYARAVVESCGGCTLKRLTDVKEFIFEDLKKYQHAEFKQIQGAKPELVLLDEDDNELDRIYLGTFNRKGCNDLMLEKGFSLKSEGQESSENLKHEL